MSGYLEFTLGSCWDIDLRFTNEDGSPVDVTSDEFEVIDAKPTAITNAVFTKEDAAGGLVHMHLAAEHMADMRVGGNYSFRVSRITDGIHVDNTPVIAVAIL
jgi:hypothetical protein